MNRARRWTLPLLLALALGGCIDSQLLQRDPTIGQFYTLDTERLRLCQGSSVLCHDLVIVAYSRTVLPEVEKIYGAEVRGPNYPLSFARLLMNPPGGEYQPSAVGSDSRYLRLPANELTDTAWRALERTRKQPYE
ncbi:hypothetical protein [Marinobacterium zhoushanense]|nr:hypothetical protein [Marinobacterium zhoushanense]